MRGLPEPGEAERAAAGERAAEHLASLVAYQRAEVLALYCATPGELDTRVLFQRATRDGKRCAFPRCLPKCGLEFAEVADVADLTPGPLGILEPRQGLPLVELGEGALVIVPGLAFDAAGRRLGRGAGYYDRAFADPEGGAILVGFAYSVRVIDEVPSETHDRRMDAVVSERGFHLGL